MSKPKRYSVLIAYDVPCYAQVIVEADNPEEANRKALEQALERENHFEPNWEASSEYRIADDAAECDEQGKLLDGIVQ